MRIISGRFGGRIIESPGGHRTHPMSDKARGGLFNTLGDITDLRILDAFAGSGALSFEALSRGAKQLTAIDIDRRAHETIRLNANSLGLKNEIKIIKANASGWSDRNPDDQFDIVIAAPPYDNLQIKLLSKLARHVKPGGLYVLDWPGGQTPPALPGLEIVTANNYGDAQIIFLKQV